MSSEGGFAFLIWGVWHGLRSKAELWYILAKSTCGAHGAFGWTQEGGCEAKGSWRVSVLLPWGLPCPGRAAGMGPGQAGETQWLCQGQCSPGGVPWVYNLYIIAGIHRGHACPLWIPANKPRAASSKGLWHHNHRSASVPERWVSVGHSTI